MRHDVVEAWKGRVSSSLESVKYYPSLAITRGQYGTVKIKFVLNRDGRDAEALAIVMRAEPFPRPPDELTGESYVVLPAAFR